MWVWSAFGRLQTLGDQKKQFLFDFELFDQKTYSTKLLINQMIQFNNDIFMILSNSIY